MRSKALPLLAVVVAGTVLVSGCLFEDQRVDPSELPSITFEGSGTCPTNLSVRLTNNRDVAMDLSGGGFQLTYGSTDVNETQHALPDDAAMSALGTEAFPRTGVLAPHESAAGILVFDVSLDAPPYLLRYSDNVSGSTVELAPRPAGEDGCGVPVQAAFRLSPDIWRGLDHRFDVWSVDWGPIAVDEATFAVVADNGTVYFDGAPGEGSAVNGVVVTISYDDVDGDGKVSVDDRVGLRVRTPAERTQVAGASLRGFVNGDLAAEVEIDPFYPALFRVSLPTPWEGTSTRVNVSSVDTALLQVASLSFEVVAANGTVLFNGTSGTGTATAGVVVTVTYEESGTDGFAREGDVTHVAVGAANQMHGVHLAKLSVWQGGVVLDSVTLPDDLTPTITVEPGHWEGGVLQMAVTEVSTTSLFWSLAEFVVEGANGTVLFNGSAGTGTAVGGTTVSLEVDDMVRANRIDIGDGLDLSVSPAGIVGAVAGGSLVIMDKGSTIATLQLPEIVPIQLVVEGSPQGWSGGHSIVVITDATAEAIEPGELTFLLKATNGTVYYNGSAGTREAPGGLNVTLFFDDGNADGWVGFEDFVDVQVDPPAGAEHLGNATLEFQVGGETVGTVTLPAAPPMAVNLTLSNYPWGGAAIIIKVDAASGPLSPATLSFQLYASNGTLHYAGSAGATIPIAGVTVTINFNDNPVVNVVGQNDTIVITLGGTDEVPLVSGATLIVLDFDVEVGRIVLP